MFQQTQKLRIRVKAESEDQNLKIHFPDQKERVSLDKIFKPKAVYHLYHGKLSLNTNKKILK